MDANSFLMGGGGAPTAKFPSIGTVVGGRITEPPTIEQQRDIQTGEQKTWNNGDPMMQLVVTVQTDDRDPAIEDDDGRRRIFVKGQMKNAVADAVRVTGAKGLEVGGILRVRYSHDGEKKKVGFNAPKLYDAHYTPAAQAEFGVAPAGVNTATGEIASPPPAAPQQYAAPAVPAQQRGDEPPF